MKNTRKSPAVYAGNPSGRVHRVEEITVNKHNSAGKIVFSYSGCEVARRPGALLIEAFFNRDDLPFHGITFRRGDRFLEAYFADRWYNIFEIYDVGDGRLKCWYCNVATPARFDGREINYEDLAIDLLIHADGSQMVLDMDEFSALNLPPHVAVQAQDALHELKRLFADHNGFRVMDLFDRPY